MHTYVHARTHTHTRAHAHAHTHTHTHAHAHTHTHTHAHTHTHVPTHLIDGGSIEDVLGSVGIPQSTQGLSVVTVSRRYS